MSDNNSARQTSVAITFDGTDISKDIKPYFLSLTFTDNEDGMADDLQIKVQDRKGIWMESWLDKAVQAAAGGKLAIKATITRENWTNPGTKEDLDTGTFELDRVDASGPPAVVTMKATSLAFSSPARQTKKSKAWEHYTLSGIAGEIAGNGGMTLMYESSSDPSYARVEQTKVSDIDFLAKLCREAAISLKVTDSLLVLFDQATYEAKPPVATIKHGKAGGYTKYKLGSGSADTQYASCRVSYMDPGTGALIEGVAESGDAADSGQRLEITAKVGSAGEAKALAEKHLRLHNKYAKTVTLTFPFRPDLVAGVTIMMKEWGGWSGKYIITQAKHQVTSSGSTTQVIARKVLDAAPEQSSAAQEESGEETTYTVKKGDSLWAIAVKFYGDGTKYTKIQEANAALIAKHGKNPNMIWPGDVLVIP